MFNLRITGKLKKVIAMGLLVAAIFGLSASPVSAAFDLNTTSDCGFMEFGCYMWVALQNFLLMVFLWTGKLFAFLLELVTKGTVFLIKLGVDMASNDAVRVGFKSTLGVTNMIFVVAIIIIAFATILRIENYGIKKMLPKLIIAALLVNFSLLIAGLFIDMSNVFTKYFLDGGMDANGIASSFDPQRLLAPTAKTEIKLHNNSLGQFMQILMTIAVAILMTIIMTVVMVWVMIMVLVRNIWIVFLLIIMPLIWGFWVLPIFQKHWSKWWENFLKWVLYLPSVTFFLWLAIQVAHLSTFRDSFTGDTDLSLSSATGKYLPQSIEGESIFSLILRMLIVLGLIVGGARVGKAFGIVGSAALLGGAAFLGGAALSGLKKAGSVAVTSPLAGGAAALAAMGAKSGEKGVAARKWAGKFFGLKNTGKTMARGASRALSGNIPKFAGKITDLGDGYPVTDYNTRANKIVGFLNKASRFVPGGTQAANALAGYGENASMVEEYRKKNFSQLSDEDFKALVKRGIPVGTAARAAVAEEAKARHAWDAIPHGQEETYMNAVKEMNVGKEAKDIDAVKDFLKHHPSMAGTISGQAPSQVRAKMSGAEVADMDRKEFEDSLAEGHFTPSQLAGAAQKNGEIEDLIRVSVARTLQKAGPILGERLTTQLKDLKTATENLATAREDLKTNKGDPTRFDTFEAVAKQQRELITATSASIRGLTAEQKRAMEAIDPAIIKAIDVSSRLDRAVSSGGGKGGDGGHGGSHGGGHGSGGHAPHRDQVQSEWEGFWEGREGSSGHAGDDHGGHDNHGGH